VPKTEKIKYQILIKTTPVFINHCNLFHVIVLVFFIFSNFLKSFFYSLFLVFLFCLIFLQNIFSTDLL